MDRTKITRLAFITVILSFLLSTFVSLWSITLMSQHNSEEVSKLVASRIFDSMTEALFEPVAVSRTMANDSLLIETLKKEDEISEEEAQKIICGYLAGIKNGLEYESSFVISDNSKRYYSFSGIEKVLKPDTEKRDGWYVRLKESGSRYVIDVDYDEFADNKWKVFVDATIESSGKFMGVCGVGSDISESIALIASLEKEYDVKINLVDKTGLIQIDTDESRIHNASIDDVKLSSTSLDYVYQDIPGKKGYAVSRYVDGLDWYLVVSCDSGSVTGKFTNIILLNIVLCAFVLAILFLSIRIIAVRTRALTHASLRDKTTSLLNRRAFEEEKEKLEQKALRSDLVYVTADVNGLKSVNDNLGHEAGDELITGAARCLKACFGRFGKIYRIGGDEFACLLHITDAELKEARSEFESLTSDWSGELVKNLYVSLGYASVKEFPDDSLAEIARKSDERMYEAKAEYYRKNGLDRRRR